jgi:hypothetical protein
MRNFVSIRFALQKLKRNFASFRKNLVLFRKNALVPVYNHVFMALPIEPKHTEPLFSEILRFLWTRQVDGHTKQKRRLVAKKRISAGLEMGGLGIQNPD